MSLLAQIWDAEGVVDGGVTHPVGDWFRAMCGTVVGSQMVTSRILNLLHAGLTVDITVVKNIVLRLSLEPHPDRRGNSFIHVVSLLSPSQTA